MTDTTETTDEGGLLDNAAPVDEKVQTAKETTEASEVAHRTQDKPDVRVTKQKPDFIPEKFWDSEKNEPRLEAMAKSYAELEKNFKIGKHKPPEGGKYDLTPFDGKVKPDDPVMTAYTEWAGKHGLSQAAFEELAAKVVEIGSGMQTEAQLSRKAELDKLGENGPQMIGSMLDWARGFVRSGVWTAEDFEEFKIWGGTAAGLRALMRMRETYEGRIPLKETLPVGEESMSDEELRAQVGKEEYWKDPAFREKVTQMFQRRYGNNA
jgi:hypothetical protein